jgi:hypothetical protein
MSRVLMRLPGRGLPHRRVVRRAPGSGARLAVQVAGRPHVAARAWSTRPRINWISRAVGPISAMVPGIRMVIIRASSTACVNLRQGKRRQNGDGGKRQQSSLPTVDFHATLLIRCQSGIKNLNILVIFINYSEQESNSFLKLPPP